MPKVQFIAYRYLTDADFFNIYKPSGIEQGGGGQTYIDFPARDISSAEWRTFFHQLCGLTTSKRAQGDSWEFPIHSIGQSGSQQRLVIYQRRPQSFSISSQNINTRNANRVKGWLPQYGFPVPPNPSLRHAVPSGLGVFLVRTDGGEVWAGWFTPSRNLQISLNGNSSRILEIVSPPHRAGDAAMIDLRSENIDLDVVSGVFSYMATATPVTTPVMTPRRKEKSEEELAASLLAEDEEPEELQGVEIKQKVQKVRERNAKVAAALKQLYQNRCQISGNTYSFMKKDGTGYSEVHHLIPLSEGGADKPINLVVLSPMLHRMLHYADAQGIDLSKVKHHADGTATLDIKINGAPYTITWHADHAKLFLQQ